MSIKKQFKFTTKLHFKSLTFIPVYSKNIPCTVPTFLIARFYSLVGSHQFWDVVRKKKQTNCMGTHKRFQLLCGRRGRGGGSVKRHLIQLALCVEEVLCVMHDGQQVRYLTFITPFIPKC
jgi:hypothetical protein